MDQRGVGEFLLPKDEDHDDSVMFNIFLVSITCKNSMLNVSVISFNPHKSCLELSIMISKIDTWEFALSCWMYYDNLCFPDNHLFWWNFYVS